MTISLQMFSNKMVEKHIFQLKDNRLSLIQVKANLLVHYIGADGEVYHINGICIAIRKNGMGSSFTVLAIDDNIHSRVELTLPLYSPAIEVYAYNGKEGFKKPKLTSRNKPVDNQNESFVRDTSPAPKKTSRAKLYFLRTKYGKQAKRYLRKDIKKLAPKSL